MKIKEILDPETLNFREALNDPYIFALSCHHQDKSYCDHDKETGKALEQELRCSCRPIVSMTAKSLREIFSKPNDFVLIRIEP